MKKPAAIFLMVTGISVGLLSFTAIKNSGIQGKVSPAEGVLKVLAISGTDTLNTEINNGSFMFSTIKTGTYTLLIKTKLPYKDTSVTQVAVIDSAITDVGEIKLRQ